MSAGVSDQRMKGQGNQVINSTSKNVEKDDRFIPWSQQVDDAPYEPVPSPTEGSQTGCYESSPSGGGTQFQYPPFKVKDGVAWSGATGNNSKSSRRLSSSNDNYDSDGTYGSSSHNNFPKNGDFYNSWSSQGNPPLPPQMNNAVQNRKANNHDEYYRSDRGNYQNDNIKVMQRGMQHMAIDGRSDERSSKAANSHAEREKPTGQTSSAPKQMTWASIASQPAKQPLRSNRFTSSNSSTLKKKGPGMPPPPMVPGKHNMDIGTWDSPKNGPQLVPPPPPPVIPVPIMEPPVNQNKNSSNISNRAPQGNVGGGGSGGSGSIGSGPPNVPHNKQGFNNQPNRNYNQNVSTNSSNNNNNMRPSWADRDPPAHVEKRIQSGQMQRPSVHEGHNNSTSRQSSREDYSIHRNDHQHHPPQSVSPLPPVPAPANYPPQATSPALSSTSSNYAMLEELRDRNNYNPAVLDVDIATNARFFVIKSYSEDDIHRSIKYGIWCSTEHGNKRLDQAFRERESEKGLVMLFFSVNGSGHFCGMAHMLTAVDYNSVSNVWSQAKWKGTFKVKWIYVKDVPNPQLRHIRLENNENKSVTNSRDTQEVPNAKGIQVLHVLHNFKHTTSIFDDFFHYEKRQEEEDSKKYEPPAMRNANNFDGPPNMSPPSKSQRGGSGDYDRDYGKGYSSGGSAGGFKEKSYGRGGGGGGGVGIGGGYHSGFDNRRQYDDHRGGNNYDRERERDRDRYPRDGPASGHYNNIRGDNRDRENSGDDYNNRGGGGGGGAGGGFYRNDFRRDDRERGFNRERDRERDRENFDDGFMSRSGDNGRSGGFNRGDQYNRDRGDHNRGRGRMGQRN